MKNNFIQRAVTGVLFVIVLVGCILYSPLSFGILFTIINALSVHEFAQLVSKSGEVSINKTITALGGAYLFLALMSFCTQQSVGARVFLPYLGLLLYMMITELYLKKKNPTGNWAYSMLSQLYVALPFALLNVLAFRIPRNGQCDLQPYSTAFHFRIYLVERYRCLLRRFADRQTPSVRTYLT